MTPGNDTCREWNDREYSAHGFASQRLYPNEELCRFLGRHFFSRTTREERRAIKVLELGCGSCSNLWMVAREGFDAHGIDLSGEAVRLGHRMLASWGQEASLTTGDMCSLPYEENEFDVVIDVFSSYSLPLAQYRDALAETAKVLKPGGLFFSYTPSAASDAFRNHAPSEKLDEWTLDGIRRPGSPFTGNAYPFRFMDADLVHDLFPGFGLDVTELELSCRTYNRRSEYFEFLCITARLLS